MDSSLLRCGATIYTSKVIPHPKGNVLHGLKLHDPGFVGFGEVYFSMVNFGAIKGWKKHHRMSMNLLVPKGRIRFHLEAEESEVIDTVILGDGAYARLFVPPGIWMAFEGLDRAGNILMNFADIEHDPSESIAREFVI